MKLARMKNGFSRFKVPYKVYNDNQEIPQEFQLVSNDVYESIFQHVIFQDGVFDYNEEQQSGIIGSIENSPCIFVTDGAFIVQQIPFETKIDVNNGHVFIKCIFAIDKNSMDKYQEMRIQFQNKLKDDLLKYIEKQISDLEATKKFLIN